MILEILKFTEERIKAGEKVALITIIAPGGGTPGATGQVMAVATDGKTKGTVGGGNSEHLIIEQAIKTINSNEKFFEFEFKLEEKGMICGGSVKGFATILGTSAKLIIFGGGHVSQKIYEIAKNTDFNIIIIEDREEYKEYFAKANYMNCNINELEDKLTFDENTYVIICTRGHKFDSQALGMCVQKNTAYIGMIGSKQKVNTLFETLRGSNIDEKYINKVYAPIGLNIDNGTPGEIAVSVMAEILKIKNNGSLTHMKLT